MSSTFFKESISVDEVAATFSRLVWEVIGKLQKDGFTFIPQQNLPDKLSMKCDWELGHFANIVTYLMIAASQELQPYSTKIGSKLLNGYTEALDNMSRDSLIVLDVVDTKSLLMQFRLRFEAYSVAFLQAHESQKLVPSNLFSLLIYVLKENGDLGSIDKFLEEFLSRPKAMFESLPLQMEAGLKAHRLLTDLFFNNLMTTIGTATNMITKKYRITD